MAVMELTPRIYHLIVRPRLLTKLYIEDILTKNFDLDNRKVLDFGSGVGAISSMFLPENYLGIDCDPKRVDYARRFNPDYTFKVSRGNDLPVVDNSIESILIIAVLHHISSEHFTDCLQEFKRVLKPHGNVLVMEPCLFENSRFNNWFMKCFDNGKHIRTEEEYMKLFRDQGFRTNQLNRYRKIVYNEICFSAVLQS